MFYTYTFFKISYFYTQILCKLFVVLKFFCSFIPDYKCENIFNEIIVYCLSTSVKTFWSFIKLDYFLKHICKFIFKMQVLLCSKQYGTSIFLKTFL